MLGSGLFLILLATIGAYYLFRPILLSGVERELTTAAQRLADRLEQAMFERWQDIKLAAGRQVRRDRVGDDAEREVVEEIKARHPRGSKTAA